MKTTLIYFSAAASLAMFAYLLILVDSAAAERAYAAYGGVYIVSSLIWLWTVEGGRPERWDTIGALVALSGAAIILFGPRAWPPAGREITRTS